MAHARTCNIAVLPGMATNYKLPHHHFSRYIHRSKLKYLPDWSKTPSCEELSPETLSKQPQQNYSKEMKYTLQMAL